MRAAGQALRCRGARPRCRAGPKLARRQQTPPETARKLSARRLANLVNGVSREDPRPPACCPDWAPVDARLSGWPRHARMSGAFSCGSGLPSRSCRRSQSSGGAGWLRRPRRFRRLGNHCHQPTPVTGWPAPLEMMLAAGGGTLKSRSLPRDVHRGRWAGHRAELSVESREALAIRLRHAGRVPCLGRQAPHASTSHSCKLVAIFVVVLEVMPIGRQDRL